MSARNLLLSPLILLITLASPGLHASAIYNNMKNHTIIVTPYEYNNCMHGSGPVIQPGGNCHTNYGGDLKNISVHLFVPLAKDKIGANLCANKDKINITGHKFLTIHRDKNSSICTLWKNDTESIWSVTTPNIFKK